jgi:hypothetical protein
MDICKLWVLCVVRGLCDGLITRPEESYRLWCVVVCDLETSSVRRLWPTGDCCAKNKRRHDSRRETNSSLNLVNSLSLLNRNENTPVSIKVYCSACSVNIRIACQTLVSSSSLLEGNAFLRGWSLKQTSTAVLWVEVTFCSNMTFNLLFETRLIMYHANCSYSYRTMVIAR